MKKIVCIILLILLIFGNAYAIDWTIDNEEDLINYLNNNFIFLEEQKTDACNSLILTQSFKDYEGQWVIVYHKKIKENNTCRIYSCSNNKEIFKNFLKYFYEFFGEPASEDIQYAFYTSSNLGGIYILDPTNEYISILSAKEFCADFIEYVYIYYSLFIA